MNLKNSSTVEQTWRRIKDTYTEVAEEVLGFRKKEEVQKGTMNITGGTGAE